MLKRKSEWTSAHQDLDPLEVLEQSDKIRFTFLEDDTDSVCVGGGENWKRVTAYRLLQ